MLPRLFRKEWNCNVSLANKGSFLIQNNVSSGSEKCGLCPRLERCSEIQESWYDRMKTAKASAQAGAFLQRLRSAGKIGLCASPESEVASAFVISECLTVGQLTRVPALSRKAGEDLVVDKSIKNIYITGMFLFWRFFFLFT